MAGTEMPPVALIGGANQAPVTPKWTNLPMEKSILEGQTVSPQSKFDKKKSPKKLGKFQLFVTKAIAKFTISSWPSWALRNQADQ